MRRRSSIACASFGVVLAVVGAGVLYGQNIKPKDGYVPNASTAVTIGEAVMLPIWGENEIAKHRPYRATLTNGVWRVEGTLPPNTLGGTAVVLIAKDDGRVMRVFHEQ